MLRVIAGVGVAAMLAMAVPVAAQAATYPPATTGTFSVNAHPGSNHITVNGLGAHASATAIISGSGAAPTLGEFHAAVHSATVNLGVGRTDADGSVTFTLVFPDNAVGVYNASVSTPDGHSVSGAITIPSKSGGALAWTGTNIAMWVVWLAGILVVIGVIALLIATTRHRTRR